MKVVTNLTHQTTQQSSPSTAKQPNNRQSALQPTSNICYNVQIQQPQPATNQQPNNRRKEETEQKVLQE
jgi:hypothetical protein